MAGAVIWGDRLIAIKRHASTSVDVEGRPVAGNLSTVVSVKGYLFHVDNTREIEGRYVVVSDVRALLPNGVNIATSDLLEAIAKIYDCSKREASDIVVTIDNDDLESVLYRAGYQDKEIVKMFK